MPLLAARLPRIRPSRMPIQQSGSLKDWSTLSAANDDQSLRLPLCWIGILDGRIRGSLAASSGIHSATDVLKLLMVGANVTMLASELMLNGIDRLGSIRHDLIKWLEEHEYTSIRQLQGSLSQRNVSFPTAFERTHYVRAVSGDVPVHSP